MMNFIKSSLGFLSWADFSALIAQWAMDRGEKTGNWQIFYLISLTFRPMIASIQELKKRNDDIEAEDAALRRDFEAYKAANP